MKDMGKCLIIINKNAGTSKKITFEKVERFINHNYLYTHITLPCDVPIPYEKYDAVAICGGDGTLSSIMKNVWDKNVKVYYFPVGTLNDKAKASKHFHKSAQDMQANNLVVGKVFSNEQLKLTQNKELSNISYCANEQICKHEKRCVRDNLKCSDIELCTSAQDNNYELFTYVFACGSFTPIGYCSSVKKKKKLGILAYILNVVKKYKPHKIPAKIKTEKIDIQGDFTLLMFIKSPRCFGFSFNKAYDAQDKSGHLIAIRTPKHKSALGYIEMFFPFFRVFFMGLKKEIIGKNLIFTKTSNANIQLFNNVDFCADGEKCTLEKGEYKISFHRSKCYFQVADKF